MGAGIHFFLKVCRGRPCQCEPGPEMGRDSLAQSLHSAYVLQVTIKMGPSHVSRYPSFRNVFEFYFSFILKLLTGIT